MEVVPETFEASLQLGGRVLEVLGASDEAVAHRLATMRDQFEEAIKAGGSLRRMRTSAIAPCAMRFPTRMF